MDSNTHSIRPERSEPPKPPERSDDLLLALPEDLAELTAALDKVGALNLDRLPATVRVQRALGRVSRIAAGLVGSGP